MRHQSDCVYFAQHVLMGLGLIAENEKNKTKRELIVFIVCRVKIEEMNLNPRGRKLAGVMSFSSPRF